MKRLIPRTDTLLANKKRMIDVKRTVKDHPCASQTNEILRSQAKRAFSRRDIIVCVNVG